MSATDRLSKMLEAAKVGGFALKKLNWALWMVIPFNKPHRFSVKEVGEDFIVTHAPFRRRNFNHIRGIHACGIATIAEFATGLLLLSRLDASRYRIIMSTLKVDYHYQAKKALDAKATISENELRNDVIAPLETSDSIFKTVVSEIKDADGNHVATAHVTWQLKRWDKVKTKV